MSARANKAAWERQKELSEERFKEIQGALLLNAVLYEQLASVEEALGDEHSPQRRLILDACNAIIAAQELSEKKFPRPRVNGGAGVGVSVGKVSQASKKVKFSKKGGAIRRTPAKTKAGAVHRRRTAAEQKKLVDDLLSGSVTRPRPSPGPRSSASKRRR